MEQGPNWVTLLEWIKGKELVEELGLKTSFFPALIGLGAALCQAFCVLCVCAHTHERRGSGDVFFTVLPVDPCKSPSGTSILLNDWTQTQTQTHYITCRPPLPCSKSY